MDALQAVKLRQIMKMTSGASELLIGFVGGPIDIRHPELHTDNLQLWLGDIPATCSQPADPACRKSTAALGVISAKRGGIAPGLCPDCQVFIRPILSAGAGDNPVDANRWLDALTDCLDLGASVIVMNAVPVQDLTRVEKSLTHLLERLNQQDALLIVPWDDKQPVWATLFSRHPRLLPVLASNQYGKPIAALSKLGGSQNSYLAVPAQHVISLAPGGRLKLMDSQMAACAIAAGTCALLCSLFPKSERHEIRSALMSTSPLHPTAVPILDAWSAYQILDHNEHRLVS